MKHCKLTALILAAAVCAACSEPETADGGPNPQTTRVTLRREGAADVAVYAFRRQGDRFLFDTLFREGWTSDGRMSVRMPNGQYKFLFASGAADRLVLAPEPLTRQTAWEEVHFALRENAEAPGTCCPADELFLQYPASDADAIHTVGGADLTVAASAGSKSRSSADTMTARSTWRFPMRNRNRYSARSTASNFRPEPRDCG